jgi:hypothetical protein
MTLNLEIEDILSTVTTNFLFASGATPGGASMLRLLKVSVLAFMLSVGAAVQASASTIIDPIVRTKLGGGSITIPPPLPFDFSFGSFPTDPDGLGSNCFVDPDIDPAGILVSCAFQNQSGQTIQFLDFDFLLPGPPGSLVFTAEDPNDLFASETANSAGAQFLGGGIAPAICDVECFGGEFIIELVGFPEGTIIDMTAAANAVPEPATLTLVVTGIGIAFARRRRKV